jgi:hypothetical protein
VSNDPIITPISTTTAPPAPSPTDSIVDAWFVRTFHGQPISTDLFNRYNTAREELKLALARAQE